MNCPCFDGKLYIVRRTGLESPQCRSGLLLFMLHMMHTNELLTRPQYRIFADYVLYKKRLFLFKIGDVWNA